MRAYPVGDGDCRPKILLPHDKQAEPPSRRPHLRRRSANPPLANQPARLRLNTDRHALVEDGRKSGRLLLLHANTAHRHGLWRGLNLNLPCKTYLTPPPDATMVWPDGRLL